MKSNSNRDVKGAFQRMGLPGEIMRAISNMGYRLPTPIQRKLIPLVQRGRDVVAMARTGSGKTAAFLIPIIARLAPLTCDSQTEAHRAVHAVILSPSRDLAIQTYRVCCALARHVTSINVVSIIGGESLNSHFDLMTRSQQRPMLVIATPGRLVHLLAEMNIKSLDSCKLLVLDEADRLFEAGDGFCEQLAVLLAKMPRPDQGRQTILTSATLSECVSHYVKSGIDLLHQPVFCTLDNEGTLNPNLRVVNVYCPREEKIYALCLLVSRNELGHSIIFASNRYEAILLAETLSHVLGGDVVNAIYGNSGMDDEHRNKIMSDFRNKKTHILVTTDVAARGVDIPSLNTVINYNFPRTPKLYVHRSGRTIRKAEQKGQTISFVEHDEVPYLLDLCTYLSRPFSPLSVDEKSISLNSVHVTDEILRESIDTFVSTTQSTLFEQVRGACKAYLRSSKTASPASVKKWKLEQDKIVNSLTTHPMLTMCQNDSSSHDFMRDIKRWRGRRTIFEIDAKSERNDILSTVAMRRKRMIEQILNNAKTPVTSSGELNSFSDNSHYIPYNRNRRSNCSQGDAGSSLSADTFRSDLTRWTMGIESADQPQPRTSLPIPKEMLRTRQLIWDRYSKRFVSGNALADKAESRTAWMHEARATAKGKHGRGAKYAEYLRKTQRCKDGSLEIEAATQIVQRRERRIRLKRKDRARRMRKGTKK